MSPQLSPRTDAAATSDTTMTHGLPGWVAWVQDHLFLSFLLVAEAYVLGSLMALGWVPSLTDPATWGWYGGAGVLIFFAAGAMAAGVALRCSITAAQCFQERRLGFAAFNFLGLLAFDAAEVWASLSERSANLRPTPADSTVLHLAGVPTLPISPTVMVVSILLPFSALYWGFARRMASVKPARESDAERAARERAQLDKARLRAELIAIKAAGARQGFQALRGKVDPLHPAELVEETIDLSPSNPDHDGGPAGVGLPGETTDTDGGVIGNKPSARSQAPLRLMGRAARPRGMLDKAELAAWVDAVCGVKITEDQALALIKNTPGNERLGGETGQPWAAPKAALQAQARKLWGMVSAEKASGE